METYFFNKEVFVDAVYFTNQNGLSSYPKHLVYDDQEVTFPESGLRSVIRKGQEAIRFFMSDGRSNYELKLEADTQAWKLLHVEAAEAQL